MVNASRIGIVLLMTVTLAWAFAHPFCAGKQGASVAEYQKALSQAGHMERGAVVVVQPPWRTDVAEALPKDLNVQVALSLKFQERPLYPIVILQDKRFPLSKTLRSLTKSITASGDINIVTLEHDESTFRIDSYIDDAQVEVEKADGSIVECSFSKSANKHLCKGLPEWMHVGERELESGGQTRRCLWAHPISKGEVRITFAPMVLPNRLTLVHGFKSQVAQRGGDVVAALTLEGRPLGTATAKPISGFQKKTLTLGESAQKRSLSVKVKTENDGARHYCFSLEADDAAQKQKKGAK